MQRWVRRFLVAGLVSLAGASGCGTESASSQLESVSGARANVEGTTAGEEWEVGGVRLCWCPAGRFRMGSPLDEPGRREDEAQVEVTLSSGFWMGKYEVTQGQWRRVVGEQQKELRVGKGDDFPVYWVSYEDVLLFARKLTEEAHASGRVPASWEFHLPTEAQWEYACRAGTTTAFSFGTELTLQQANFGRWKRGQDESPTPSAERVGRYPPNAWGLHDMHGNEFEWCRDWYHRQLPGGVDPDRSDVKGEPNRDGTWSRSRRGGAWTDETWACRSAFRLRFEPWRSANHIGFRIALVRAAGKKA
jgi:formylglycine-generating enzyme required for sulfatase activity